MTSSSPEPMDDDVKCLIGRRTAKDKSWLPYVCVSSENEEISHRRTISCSSSDSMNNSNKSSSSLSSDEEESAYHTVPISEAAFENLTMTIEQLQYYSQQFDRMKPNPISFDADTTLTKQFFELSNLSEEVLREIWLLADQNEDVVNGVSIDHVRSNLDLLNPYKILDAPLTESPPALKEFTSSLDSCSALIAPKPIRIISSAVSPTKSATTIFNSEDIRRDLRSNIHLAELDGKLLELAEKLKACPSDDLTRQAYINSEVDGSLMHWQRMRNPADHTFNIQKSDVKLSFHSGVSQDLIALTYGALVAELCQQDEPDKVNNILEDMGTAIGSRLIEDYISRKEIINVSILSCSYSKLIKHLVEALKTYLGFQSVINVKQLDISRFQLNLPSGLTDFVQLPNHLRGKLHYCQLFSSAIKAAFKEIQCDVEVWIENDCLENEELKETFIEINILTPLKN
ncbi:hypothetical protein GJ496_011787 [Pomphorhynchus laevis]|nr:hypothetical protein GJ496_011787 [Pomphorhynchus laevis]